MAEHTKFSYFLNNAFPHNSDFKDRRASKFCQVVSFGIFNSNSLQHFLSGVALKPEKQTAYDLYKLIITTIY